MFAESEGLLLTATALQLHLQGQPHRQLQEYYGYKNRQLLERTLIDLFTESSTIISYN